MPIKKYKSTTNGRRGMTSLSFDEITATKPQRSLIKPRKKNAGEVTLGNGTLEVHHRSAGGLSAVEAPSVPGIYFASGIPEGGIAWVKPVIVPFASVAVKTAGYPFGLSVTTGSGFAGPPA